MEIKSFFIRNRLGPARIFAGFSGGADSTALLLLLHDYCSAEKIELVAVHFEHGLRGREGTADAEWCRKFCEIRKIHFIAVTLDVPGRMKRGEGDEEAARRLRLEGWRKIACRSDDLVALGHSADDRIENLFLRLLRGSNTSGLSSLRETAKFAGLTFIRPILPFRRSEIEKFLRSRKAGDWRTDSSNLSDIYRRNLIRRRIVRPLRKAIPGADQGILKSLEAIGLDADFLESTARRKFDSLERNGNFLPPREVLGIHPAILIRLLRLWISEQLGSDFIPDGNFLSRVLSESAKFAGKKSGARAGSVRIPVRDGKFLAVQHDRISLDSGVDSEIPGEISWNWRKIPEIEWGAYRICAEITRERPRNLSRKKDEGRVYFDARQMPDRLLVRPYREGDRMIPFGSRTGEVRLKKIFESAKITSADRRRIPLVCIPGGAVIWAAGARRAKFADIARGTAQFAVFEVRKKP